MARGGKREGAGGKEGAIRPHLSHFWTEKQIRTFYQHMYKRQKKSDRIAVWCGEQLSGKAVQPLSNADGSNLTITFDGVFSQSSS